MNSGDIQPGSSTRLKSNSRCKISKQQAKLVKYAVCPLNLLYFIVIRRLPLMTAPLRNREHSLEGADHCFWSQKTPPKTKQQSIKQHTFHLQLHTHIMYINTSARTHRQTCAAIYIINILQGGYTESCLSKKSRSLCRYKRVCMWVRGCE